MDNLTYIDDIELSILKDDKEETHYVPKLIPTYKSKPFKHQLEGIEFGLNCDSWLLLDEPGLGKTLQMIYLAEELKAQKGLEHCFIICGVDSLKSNWEDEIHKHSNEKVRMLGKRLSKRGKVTYASIKERASELMEPIEEFFIVTNITTIRSDDVVNALKLTKNKIGMVVLDEAHKIKNSSSQQGANLLKLKNYEHKIALTGTLIVNKPLDAFTALKWVGVEKATLTNFKNQYCVYGGFGGHEIVGYKNIDILKEEISQYSLRRLKSELKDLPPKTVISEVLEMNDSHRKFYDNIVDGVKEECDKIVLQPNNILSLTTRLRQATTAPSVLTTNPIPCTKYERAIELVEDIIQNGDKVVIMSTFKDPLMILYNLLKEYHPLLGTGDVDDDQFAKNVKLFQEDPKYKIFLGTTSKSGTGITLNSAAYMICLDTPFTYALQQQVEDRIHRVNNTEPVFVYRLICKGTIDERIQSILATKEAMSDFIVDDSVNEEEMALLKQYIQDL